MTARPQTKLAMRPMLPADVPLLAEIFRASIEELSADDYSEAQQEAWASAADDEEEFGARLAGELTLVATFDGRRSDLLRSPATKTSTCCTCIRSRPGRARRDALRCAGKARRRPRRKELSVEASDTARGFFEKRGFKAQQRNTVSLAGEWLANTTMIKPLGRRRGSCHETRRRAVPAPLALLSRLKYAVIAAAVAVTLYTVYRLYQD